MKTQDVALFLGGSSMLLNLGLYVVLLSSFGASENLNNELPIIFFGMILENLETLVADEARAALLELGESAEVLDVQVDELHGSLPEISDDDLSAFENTSYSIDIQHYESSAYEGSSTKNYYELVNAGGTYSVSGTSVESFEHDLLVTAQNVASNMGEGDCANRPYIDSDIDSNLKHAKDSVKLFSPALWIMMYDGKITFN